MIHCPIQIEENCLLSGRLEEFLDGLRAKTAIITDDRVAALYGSQIEKRLRKKGLDVTLLTFPRGESSKVREIKASIEDQMLALGFARDSVIVAVGGGVTLDLAGFIAATYCRGIPYVSCPTTLLAMADACLGGKVGVNVAMGKNMIGAFYEPEMIFIDPAVLGTLPDKEIREGLVEMIKHGLVSDLLYFEFFEKHFDEIMHRDQEILMEAIERSCQIKQSIVKDDEREKGKRRLLNFGHTIGHAIESLTGYGVTHGYAVSLGLMVEATLSKQLTKLSSWDCERIISLLQRNMPDLSFPAHISIDEILLRTEKDKKSLLGAPRYVLLRSIGVPCSFEGNFCIEVSQEEVKEAIESCLKCGVM